MNDVSVGAAPRCSNGREARGPVVLAISLGAFAALAPQLMRLGGLSRSTTLLAMVAVDVSAALMAAVLLAHAGRARAGTERTVWTTMAVGAAGWAAGSTIWAGYLASGRALPAPSVADVFFLLFPLSWCVAIVLSSGRPASGSRRSRSLRTFDLLDSVIVALSSLLVLWVVAFRVSGLTETDRGALTTMVYPVADSVVITLLVRAIRRSTIERRALGLLVAGMVIYTIGDLAFLVVTYLLEVADAVPSIVDSTWVTGFALIGGGAWIALGGAEHAATTADVAPMRRHVGVGTFPLVMGAIAATVGLLDLAVSDGGSWSVATLVLLMLLLLTRQSLTLRENRRLSTELVRSVRTLEHRAGHDPLTSLPNRQHLAERLTALVATSDPSTRSAVMFLDIDLLKPINDSLGHRQGDRLIRVVADRLRARWGGDVIRFGGDEFVVLLRHRRSVEEIGHEAAELVEAMRQPDTLDDVVFEPSVSVGVAIVESGITPDELLRRADVALYHVKELGRGRSKLFVTSMDDSGRRRVEIEAQMRAAIDGDQFELHYQPVVELDTGRVTSVEALLRWRHPELGLLTPDRFLAEAESLGLLRELGRRSLIEATTRFAGLEATLRDRPVCVSVNLSAGELDGTVVLDVEEALRSSTLDPSLLVLEITEDVIVDDSVRRTLTELRRLGIGIAIDDFGTGNSSLRQLGEYPATALKIDRSFVDGISDEDDRSIVAAIVELARRLGLTTVAEGVETVEQAQLLASLGCDHAQGWLFERALPFDELVRRWFDRPDAVEHVRQILAPGALPDDALPDDAPVRPHVDVVSSPQSRLSASSAPSMIRSSSSATDGSSSMTPTT